MLRLLLGALLLSSTVAQDHEWHFDSGKKRRSVCTAVNGVSKRIFTKVGLRLQDPCVFVWGWIEVGGGLGGMKSPLYSGRFEITLGSNMKILEQGLLILPLSVDVFTALLVTSSPHDL